MVDFLGVDVPAWISAIATAALVLVGALAWFQIREVRNARVTEILMELGRRWDSAEMILSRSAVDALHEKNQLRSEIEKCFKNKGKRYYELLREPGFLEDLAVIFYSKAMRKDQLLDSMGLLVPERWKIWQTSIRFLREQRGPHTFDQFERLQTELAQFRYSYSHRVREWIRSDKVASWATLLILVGLIAGAAALGVVTSPS